MIISIAEARAQIRNEDHSFDDEHIQADIEAADAAVLAYLKLTSESDIPPSVFPVAVKAVKLLVAEWYKNREAEQDGAVESQFGYGYLPRPVIALLYPYRDPSIA